MKVQNVRPWAVEIGVTGQTVDPGGTVEVDDDLGSRLCEQPANWQETPSKKATKADDNDKKESR